MPGTASGRDRRRLKWPGGSRVSLYVRGRETIWHLAVAEGYVINEQDVEGYREAADTAEVRTVIDASRGCEHLERGGT